MIGAPLDFNECFSQEDLPPPQDTYEEEIAREKAMSMWVYDTAPSMTTLPGLDWVGFVPGLVWYRYDQGYFADDPTWFTASLTPSAVSLTRGWEEEGPQDMKQNPTPVPTVFSALFKGYFIPRTTGVHRFTLASGNASHLWWGQSAATEAQSKTLASASISLPGFHRLVRGSTSLLMNSGTAYPLSIMYGQNTGPGIWNLRFSFTVPGSSTVTTDGDGYFFAILPEDTVISADVLQSQNVAGAA